MAASGNLWLVADRPVEDEPRESEPLGRHTDSFADEARTLMITGVDDCDFSEAPTLARLVGRSTSQLREWLIERFDPDRAHSAWLEEGADAPARMPYGVQALIALGAVGQGLGSPLVPEISRARLGARFELLASLTGIDAATQQRSDRNGSLRVKFEQTVSRYIAEAADVGRVDSSVPGAVAVEDVSLRPGRGADLSELLRRRPDNLGVRPTTSSRLARVARDPRFAPCFVSQYVHRADRDGELRDALKRVLGRSGVSVLYVTGPPCSGKTRALLECLDAWALDHPDLEVVFAAPGNRTELDEELTRAAAGGGQRLVLWLDKLSRFDLGLHDWAKRLQALQPAHSHVAILATSGGSDLDTLRSSTRSLFGFSTVAGQLRSLAGPSAHEAVLAWTEVAWDGSGFADAEPLKRIRDAFDNGVEGPWTKSALDGAFVRALSDLDALEYRLREGLPDPSARGQAVAWAVLAWRVATLLDMPAPRAFIHDAHVHSPLGASGRCGTPAELDDALAWAAADAIEGSSSLIDRTVNTATGATEYVARAEIASALVARESLPTEVFGLVDQHSRTMTAELAATSRQAARLDGRVTTLEEPDSVSPRESLRERGSVSDERVVHGAAWRSLLWQGRLSGHDGGVRCEWWSMSPVVDQSSVVSVQRGTDRRVARAERLDGMFTATFDISAPTSRGGWVALARSLRIATID